jgi:hypothetical protein
MELTDLAVMLANAMPATFHEPQRVLNPIFISVSTTMNGHFKSIAFRSQKEGYVIKFKP